MIPRLAVTAGEPAGIGPDIVLSAAMQEHSAQLVAIGSAEVLAERAQALNLPVTLAPYSSTDPIEAHTPGTLPVVDIPLNAACTAGKLNTANAPHVLAVLDQAIELCRSGECHGVVTAPVHKGVINEAGIPFSGHTEYLADAFDAKQVLMLLTSPTLRVALVTTHLPLSAVPNAITQERLSNALEVLEAGLRTQFACDKPRIIVLGLNPHAGEGGHLGHEEHEVIEPACAHYRSLGWNVSGPVAADTAFLPGVREQADAYLAMYHDQGLTVLKSEGFEHAVNVTLGLPIIRTSVDHGTALNLAGKGGASYKSCVAAIGMAHQLAASQLTKRSK